MKPICFAACVVSLALLVPLESSAQKKKNAGRPVADLVGVKYGPHQRNVLDLWKGKSEKPTPLVVYIPGGGFRGGGKESIPVAILEGCLENGISVMAINYVANPGIATIARYVNALGKEIEWRVVGLPDKATTGA